MQPRPYLSLLQAARSPILKNHAFRQQCFGAVRTIGTAMDYKSLKTPASVYADFCLVPIGTGSPSVANEVAAVQKVLKESGLKYVLHSAGTTVEGNWDEVFAAIGKATEMVHQSGSVRIQTSMRVGSRTDKKQTGEDKIKRVEDLLSESKS